MSLRWSLRHRPVSASHSQYADKLAGLIDPAKLVTLRERGLDEQTLITNGQPSSMLNNQTMARGISPDDSLPRQMRARGQSACRARACGGVSVQRMKSAISEASPQPDNLTLPVFTSQY